MSEDDGFLKDVDVSLLVSGQTELPPVQMFLESLERALPDGGVDLVYLGFKESRIVDELLYLVVLGVTAHQQVSVSQQDNVHQLAPVFCLNCNFTLSSGILFLAEKNCKWFV